MFGFMLFRCSCVAKAKTNFFKQDEYPFQTKEIDKESLIYYVNKIFRKTVIFYMHKHVYVSACKKNFPKNFANVLPAHHIILTTLTLFLIVSSNCKINIS